MKKSKAVIKFQSDQKKKLDQLRTRLEELEKIQRKHFDIYHEITNNRDQFDYFRKYVYPIIEEERRIHKDINRINTELGECIYINFGFGSDINAYEVIEMKTPNVWLVRELNAVLKKDSKKALKDSFIPGGYLGTFDNSTQEWEFSSNESGIVLEIRRKNENYDFKYCNISVGISDKPIKYRDFNF